MEGSNRLLQLKEEGMKSLFPATAKIMVGMATCGVAAGAGEVWASVAIAGVLGAYLIMFPGGRVHVMMGRGVIPMPAIVVIGFWALLQVFSSFGAVGQGDTGGVAYMAHVGGFVAGLILGMLFGVLQRTRLRSY